MVKFRWETEFKKTPIGEIPKDWIETQIKDIGRVVTGKTPPTKKKEFWKNDYPFITPSDIEDYDVRYFYRVERFVSKSWVEKNPQLLVPPNSICFVCIGSTIGKICLTKEPSTTNQQINTVIPYKNKFDPLFVFYLLRGHQFRIKEEYGGGGAAKDIISKSKFESVIIPIPPTKEEQRRIATVLSWFDDLIENKRKQNEILEKTAMAIFKSWFIDFGPFQDEEFIYSEELDMEIPKGWEVKPIGEVADIISGFSYKSSEKLDNPDPDSYVFITLKNTIEGGGFNPEYSWIRSERLKKRHFLRESDLILPITEQTKDARLLGSPGIVVFPPEYSKSEGVYSMDIAKVELTMEEYKYYLYFNFKFNREQVATFHSGTSILHFKIRNFKENYYLLIPPKPILKKFHSLVEPLFQKIILNEKEIMLLKKVRDTLLPQLVFGRLRVVEI
ncbi:restriction endonuclease subunit S [Thermococcus barophilus]|uniref:Type-1 restriction enzyme specificity protein n=1 Tax=Thermococcus barophilus TaxID=55802 RepID=A0A0S1XE21_THEBA|nr:restriction endonuclease subunit S [Thermococcus barophilus]ALM76052.1 type-1 restriction enzyme specificity protein [Thermococcus barophilus]